MDLNGNRVRLNFGYSDRAFNPAPNNRTYPTTPSNPQLNYTTPGTQDYVGTQDSPYGQEYFVPNHYPQQAQFAQPQYARPNMSSPQPVYQPGMGHNGNSDTNDFIQQFSNQHLNSNRAGSPAQRSRTASGFPASQLQPKHLVPPIPRSPRPSSENEKLQRYPERYSENIHKRGKAAKELVSVFFNESVEHARDRNTRAVTLDNMILDQGVLPEKKRQQAEDVAKREANFLRLLRIRESPNNFQMIKVIGKGSFGEVKLVQRRTDGKIYALKSLIKAEMFIRDQLAHVRAERDILADSKDNPWLVKLHASFQDSAYLYMLMEFLPGGDLMTMLIKQEIFSEDITRFYMAEVVMAIEAVHELGFQHRDIKPDNVLLDCGGHVKLTDFGLSTGVKKKHDNAYYQNLLRNSTSEDKNRNSEYFNDAINLTVSNRGQINTWRKSRRTVAYSAVGTPDYTAPEIFSSQGYTYLCDWWSVGAIMFECLVGWPPFCAEDKTDTYRKIINWRDCLYFPEELTLSCESESLIRCFLCNPENRIGSEGGQREGATQIKNHPFFGGVVWEQLRNIRAPFEPKLSSNIDVSYFPIDEIPQEDTTIIHRSLARSMPEEKKTEMSLPFIGYTYKAFDAFQSN